jgi:ubiquinol-cytochrome c reductase iron-sulfur subunit
MTSYSDGNNQCNCSSSTECKKAKKCRKSRREFLTYAVGAVGLAGAACALSTFSPLIDSASPDPSKSARPTTVVDVSDLKKGESLTASWGGKPVFIRRRTAKEINEARNVNIDNLPDPEPDEERVKQSIINGKEVPEWLVVVGACTHLGCVPMEQKEGKNHDEFGGWLCPCHGAKFDSSARVRTGPAFENMKVPPYQFIDEKHVKIG